MASANKINRAPLYEQVASLITSSIVDGKYKVGDQIPTEAEMAENYDVSRTVIREALKALKEKGMVETKVAKGTFVTDNYEKSLGSSMEIILRSLPEESLWNILEIRQCIEPEIVAIAAERAKTSDLERLEQNLEEMKVCVDEGSSSKNHYLEFSTLDQSFHQLLIESTGNQLLIMIMRPLVGQIRSQQLSHITIIPEAQSISYNWHKMIVEAVINKDPESARQRMREHILSVEKDFESMQKRRNKK